MASSAFRRSTAEARGGCLEFPVVIQLWLSYESNLYYTGKNTCLSMCFERFLNIFPAVGILFIWGKRNPAAYGQAAGGGKVYAMF